MTPLFDRCIRVVLRNEGGFQNNPADSGNWTGPNRTGELVGTKYGIAARFWPEEDIPNLSEERAKYLYYHYYWKPMGVEWLPDEAALHIFDHGVNAGKGVAIRMAQRMVGVDADGRIGPVTRRAISAYQTFVEDYKQERRAYYTAVARGKNAAFLQGWLNRVEKCRFS